MIIIIPINKAEAAFIRKMCPNVHVSHPTTNKKYFMEEAKHAMKLLTEFREGKHKNSVGGN